MNLMTSLMTSESCNNFKTSVYCQSLKNLFDNSGTPTTRIHLGRPVAPQLGCFRLFSQLVQNCSPSSTSLSHRF